MSSHVGGIDTGQIPPQTATRVYRDRSIRQMASSKIPHPDAIRAESPLLLANESDNRSYNRNPNALPPGQGDYQDEISEASFANGNYNVADSTIARDPDLDRHTDDYGPGRGGKKRKVPTFPYSIHRKDEDEQHFSASTDAQDQSHFHQNSSSPSSETTTLQQPRPQPRLNRITRSTEQSKALRRLRYRKTLFLRRKAALITLYLDAKSAITSIRGTKPVMMEVPVFEKLIPALEYIGMGEWPPDRPGWRNTADSGSNNGLLVGSTKNGSGKGLGLGLGFGMLGNKRSRRVEKPKPVLRGGWAPEGSFELDYPTKASTLARVRNKEIATLHRLVGDLRTIVLSSAVKAPVTSNPPKNDDKPSKTKRRLDRKDDDSLIGAASVNGDGATVSTGAQKNLEGMKDDEKNKSGTGSLEGSELGQGKKKGKKKKRGVLANQSNPHHVDNYRPTRTLSPHSDPYEPYSAHLNLLFPPPMRFLSARPRRKTAPLPGAVQTQPTIRPTEDEYICCFCEFSLFFGGESARRRAIKQRKQELKRREAIKRKAKGVTEGRKKKDNHQDDSEDSEDEVDYCEEDGFGKCTCGRAIAHNHGSPKSRLKPPETDPPFEEIERQVDHPSATITSLD